MIGKESKQNGYASLSEVLEILEDRKKERELTYEQQIAMEHAKKFVVAKVTEQKTKKALEALGILFWAGGHEHNQHNAKGRDAA